jgi:hypothetical protein
LLHPQNSSAGALVTVVSLPGGAGALMRG